MNWHLLYRYNGALISLVPIAVMVVVFWSSCHRLFYFCELSIGVLFLFSIFHIASHSLVDYSVKKLRSFIGLISNLLLIAGSIGLYLGKDKPLYLVLLVVVCCLNAILVYGEKSIK
ncbi:hypothetical protein [Vibrio atypicus]|uniref:hypothetical protein n=1 Tax=Vibrio atypicus TaxID=558271 RepID=UPI003735A5F0